MKIIQNKKGDLEINEIGKLLIGLALLLVLIAIVTIVIKGEFTEQVSSIKNLFNFF